MYDPFYAPSLEQIEQMDKQQLQAFESLQYVVSEAGIQTAVKCQRCGIAVPIIGGFKSHTNNKEVVKLQTRQKWQQNHPHFCTKEDLEETKRDLASLLEQDAKADKMRNLPLYSSKITRYKYYCSACYDWALRNRRPKPYPRPRSSASGG